jgi:catechol 2,3-dioxygenase-like lactoylglutathione lyase family enzyme
MKLVEIAFFTEDVEGTSNFYQSLLGTEPIAQSESMAIFMIEGTRIFIHRTYEPGEDDLPPENHLAFAVDNVDKASNNFQDQGLKVEAAPKNYYWGRSAYLRSPDGQLIELIESDDGGGN